MKILLTTIFFMALCESVIIASPSSPLRHIVSTFGSDYFFVMNESTDGEKSTGGCYEIADDGQVKNLWKTTGFYAGPGDLLLSPDGTKLVRMHDISTGIKNPKPIFISVYSKGKLSYSLSLDLFVGYEKLKVNPFTLDDLVTLNPDEHSPFEIIGRIEFEVLSGAKQNAAKENEWYVKVSTSDGKTSYFELETGKMALL